MTDYSGRKNFHVGIVISTPIQRVKDVQLWVSFHALKFIVYSPKSLQNAFVLSV